MFSLSMIGSRDGFGFMSVTVVPKMWNMLGIVIWLNRHTQEVETPLYQLYKGMNAQDPVVYIVGQAKKANLISP